MTLPNWTRWLPVAPVLVGAVVFVVLVRRDEADDEPLEIHSSAVVYSSLGSLVAASDLVVVAEVTGEAPGRVISSPADPRAAVGTRLLELQVDETIRGEASSALTMEEIATTSDGSPLVVDGQPASAVGERLLLFLVRGTDDLGAVAIVNGQGRYVLSATDQIIGPPSLAPVDWTLDELRRLARACDQAGTC